MVSPFLFFPGERLALSELSAACLDGCLVPLGEGFMPADAVETTWMRARSLAPLLGDRWAAVRNSAAWVYGGLLVEPVQHHLQRVSVTRVRALSSPRAVVHDVRLAPADTRFVAGVHLSTPARTLADLARSDDVREQAMALEWAASDLRQRDAALDWIDRHPRFPHAQRGGRLLAGAASRTT